MNLLAAAINGDIRGFYPKKKTKKTEYIFKEWKFQYSQYEKMGTKYTHRVDKNILNQG